MSRAPEPIADGLAAVLPADRVSAGESDRRLHGEDLSSHPAAWPDVVVFATCTDDVAATLRWAHEQRVPVVPFGAGTSLEGHITAVHGGISLDLTRMDEIVAVKPADLTVTAQAGVTRLRLERHLGEQGLQLPVDPGADATLGGMAATNAAGTMTLRHGKMRSRVLALEAVLPGGRVIRTGSHALKTSAGYDLTGLLVGSEGTLGVITELALRLEPIPDRLVLLQASFPTMALACGAVEALVALGPEVRRIELMDPWEIGALNAFGGRSLPELPLLLIELGGTEEAVTAAGRDVRDALADRATDPIREERDPTAQRQMWRLRHDAYFAEQAVAPGRATVATDVCVPVSALAATMDTTRAAMDRFGLTGGIVAHAGDGNVHAGVLVDTADGDVMGRLARFIDTIVGDALAVGGTCTGEHGIGLGKLAALEREHGDSLDLMAAIKDVFDPRGIMNPGKVLPERASAAPAG